MLSRFGYRNHKEPQATFLALYSVFQNFLAVDGRNQSQQYKECILVQSRGCTDIHMRAHIYTKLSSVALWHAFGITAVVVSERGGGGEEGGGKCLYLVLSLLPSFSPGGGSEGRENAEVETRQRGREREKKWHRCAGKTSGGVDFQMCRGILSQSIPSVLCVFRMLNKISEFVILCILLS